MSEEQSSVPRVAQARQVRGQREPQVPQGGWVAGGPPVGLLAQMDLLMAALNADLSALDAELQGAGAQGTGPEGVGPQGEGAAPERERGGGGSAEGSGGAVNRRPVNGGR
ncbi:hypothetical protein [Streptomyces sp. MMS20-AI2-20]|uniref:hypothetical protein n=1 Tax=Streptomyces sp. MMS20-AI2-20 TaxID=2925835 RepID=UPI001F6189EA|nr:hypothetical protein [Streptomyces sp. MMS20-AI2-20]MCI4140800.1 hypothetical protein [Streptomyces sp. MMS20-AI2-20]